MKPLKHRYIGPVITLCILMMGCATQKRCFTKFPPVISADTVINDTIIYRDTTIYFHLPGDTVKEKVPVYITDTVEGKPKAVTYKEAYARTEYAEARAWVDSSILELELIQKDSLIALKLDSVIALKEYYEKLYITEIHKAPPVMKCPTRSVILFLAVGFAAGVLILLIGLFFLKK